MSLKDEILADGPRLYWRMIETAATPTTAYDWSGNALDGLTNAPIGGPSLNSSSTRSRTFDGSSGSSATNDNNLLDLANTFTLEAFIKIDPTGTGNRTIIDKGSGAYWFLIDGSNYLMLYRVGSGVAAYSTVPLDTDGPHHVVATKVGATMKLFVDGVDRTGSTTNYTFTDTASQFRVGRDTGGATYFKGNISDVAVYPTALSQARIEAHYYQALLYEVAANLQGAGTLSAIAVRKQFAAVTMTGSGSIEAAPIRRIRVASDMQGVGTLEIGDPVRTKYAAAAMTGVGSLATIARKVALGAATLTGAGTLTIETRAFLVAAAHLEGEGFLRAGRQLVEIPPMPVDLTPLIVPAEAASSRLIEALTRDHKLCLVIEILDGATGQVIETLDTVETGKVDLDSQAMIRGRCDFTVIDDGLRDLIPVTASDMLAPYGNEARLARGIRFPDGTAEAVSLGVFRMRQVNPEDTGDSTPIQITGLDRWSRITDARFESMWVIPAGTNAVEAIRQTVLVCYPDCPMDLGSTTITISQTIGERGGDRGVFIQDIARSIGSELYFDGTGTLVRRPMALATDNSRWTITEGPGGALLKVGRAWDVERLYNKVITSGEPQDGSAPVCASAWDNNPLSPTYYYGKFGKRPRFYVSQMVTTEQQAALASAGILAKSLGASQQITFDQMVDPTMEPGKVVRIMRDRLGLDEKHVLDTLSIPLAATDSMPGRTRVTEVVGS